MNKIKNKLLLTLVLVTLVPAVLIGAYSLFSTSRVLQENVLSAHVNKISLIQERIENLISTVESDLLYLRDANSLHLYLSRTEESGSRTERLLLANLRTEFKKFAEQKKIYSQVRFFSQEGMEIVRIDQVDGHSKNISDTHLQDKSSRSYFTETLKLEEGDFRISDLELSRENGEIAKPLQPTLRYSTPVYDKEADLTGVIVLNIDANQIMKIIEAENKEGEQLLFVDPQGFYYYHSDESKVWSGETNLNSGHNLFKERPALEEQLKVEQTQDYVETNNDIMVYNPIAISSKNHSLGTLFSIQSKAVLFKPLKDYLKIFTAIAIGSLLLAFLLAVILSNSITRPLISLKNRVEELSKGDMEAPIEVESKDEIGDVAHAIELLRKSMKILMKRSR